MKKSFAEIVRDSAAEDLKRLIVKLPEWERVASSLTIPSRLSCEQCSSSQTAAYKAALADRILGEASGSATRESHGIADLSGGLGADSWAFACKGFSVFYNEMNPDIAHAAQKNFELLGHPQIIVSNAELAPGNASFLLGDFAPEIIYLDPARRSETGDKVFRLEDCSPNLLLLKDELLRVCRHLLVKISPMADIALVCSQLGGVVREVHIVGANGECKELLIWIDRDYDGAFEIVCPPLRFSKDIESRAVALYAGSQEDFVGKYLYEPSACMLKAGCFKLLCEKFKVYKVGISTQLYIADAIVPELQSLGKFFSVERIVPFGGRAMSDLGKEYPRCEVTARNLPVSSNEMRARMKNTSGGKVHLFACRADFSSGQSSRIIMVCERV